MTSNSDRRHFLKIGAQAAGLIALAAPMAQALADQCRLTPPQGSGPFYPGEDQFRTISDLTYVAGHAVRAKGQVVYVKGKVVDERCKPIKNANVEIWQACASGRYNNPKDPNPAPLDPNFKYWAEAFTDEDGNYFFKTIIPGAYPADDNWTRPPHIHFKVSCLGYFTLVTQMYFKGDPLNDLDLMLQQVPKAQQSDVVIDFKPSLAGFEPGSLMGNFDITLKAVRG